MASSKARSKSNLPPNPGQWQPERNGLAFRREFRVDFMVPLRPFGIASALDQVTLLRRADLERMVSADAVAEAYGPSRSRWSAVTVALNGRGHLIILNDSHADTRQNATLMEELFHIRLRHKPTRIVACPLTGLLKREYDRNTEEDAYWSAAAALIPYVSLRAHVNRGDTIDHIARHFEVSNDLVCFRLKVTKLWRLVKRRKSSSS